MAGKLGKAARLAMMSDSSKHGGNGRENSRENTGGYRDTGRQQYAYEGDFMPERRYPDSAGRMGGYGREMYGQERMSGYGQGYDRMGDERGMYGRQERMGRHYGRREEEYGEGEEDEYRPNPIRAGGTFWMDTPAKSHKLTREMAEEWVRDMENEDPALPEGGKWTMEQVKPLAQKYGIQPDSQKFIDFYVMMNAMYSDYFDVAKKFNVATPEFFAEMAKAFVCDKDAVKNKTAKYYEYIVKK